MRITVDRGSDTVHLRLAEGEGGADARALAEGVSVDYDAAGRLVGLTIRGIGRLTGAADAASTLVIDLGGHAPTTTTRSVAPAPAPPPSAAQPPATSPAVTPVVAPAAATAAEPAVPSIPAAAPTPAAAPAPPHNHSTSPTPFPAATAPSSPPPPHPAPARDHAAPVQRPSKLLPLSMAERAALGPLTWEPDAEAAMARVPFFQRGGRRIAVVETARARRLSVVTAALVDEMSGR